MKFFKKITSAVLSVCMISNFTFCSALEQPTDTDSEESKKSSSFFPYVVAGAGAVAAAIGLWAFCNRGYYNLGKTIPNVPANIKAIHWNKHRCWWMASVLFLYYWSDFKDFIYTNSNDFADVQDENCKSVLRDLREVFKILDRCDGNICYITNDEQKIKRYFDNLRKFGLEVKDGDYCEAMLIPLLTAFDGIHSLERFNIIAAENACYIDNFTGNKYNIKFMSSGELGGHYYIYLESVNGGESFAIGRSTLPDEDTIRPGKLDCKDNPIQPFVKLAVN